MVRLAPLLRSDCSAPRINGTSDRLRDRPELADRLGREDVAWHPSRALLRGLSAPLSGCQNPPARIARWGVARSTRRSGDPYVSAPATLEPALALASLSRA